MNDAINWDSVFSLIRKNPVEFATELQRLPRTHQQLTVEVLIETILSYGDAPYDPRNEYAVSLCNTIRDNLMESSDAIFCEVDGRYHCPMPLI